MLNRRDVIKAPMVGLALSATSAAADEPSTKLSNPCVISTWDFGVAANQAAWTVLKSGGSALDAVEAGARVPEADLKNHFVGRAGYPDRDGHVTLDASIMTGAGECGAVGAIEHIAHPISVARRVMERTPHVLLVGDGALQFALEQGFQREELLTPESHEAWRKWLATHDYHPVASGKVETYGKGAGGPHNHDTLGILAIGARGDLAGACTTSGMAWKLRGRLGDSPIIGAGLFVDGEVGAATSTGVGEEVIRTAGSFLVVELMRQGRTPQAACREAIERILKKRPQAKDLQVGFLAIDRKGEVGAWAIQEGFSYGLCDAAGQDRLAPAQAFYPATAGA